MKKTQGKRWILWVLLLCAAGGGLWWWVHGRAGKTAVSYKTVSLQKGDIVQTVTANGALEAVQTVEVGSEVSGKIVELMADYNSVVTNGQVLARLDASTYERELEQAQAELESSRASLKLAEANYRRAQELRALELISQADFDESEATLAQAKASLRLREASLSKVEVDLEKTTILSPMDGIVISRAVDVGQTVAASLNAPTLFTLAKDLRQMQIEAEISEADVGGVAEGQDVTFTVDAYPSKTFSGTVNQVRFEPVTVQNVVNYIAIVDVDNRDLLLRPGMTANASVVTAKQENVLRLPNAALRFRPDDTETAEEAAGDFGPPMDGGMDGGPGGGPPPGDMGPPAGDVRNGSAKQFPGSEEDGPANVRSVYVFTEDGGLRKVMVPTGITDGSWTEALAGLREGERVVTGRATAADKETAQTTTQSPFMPGPPGRH